MNHGKIHLIPPLLLDVIYPLCAQQPNHNNFIHIGVNEGLSQNTVFDIDQDKQGHMWFATHDGLNKYDGYNFTIYRHDEQNPNSIGSDVIRACIVDTQGRVWAGTEKGLSLYDASQDQFHNFTYSKDNKDLAVYDIVEIDAKQLLLFFKQKKRFVYIQYRNTDVLRQTVTSFTCENPTEYYLQTRRLYLYRKLQRRLYLFNF